MVLQVNQELCAGCGVCIDACSVEAIHMVDQQVVIDDALCTQCEACIVACSYGAITAVSAPARSAPIVALPEVVSSMTPASAPKALPETVTTGRGMTSWAGAVFAFLGSEVAPRLVDMLMNVLERRLAQPRTIPMTPLATPSRNIANPNRGIRRQVRNRGRRIGNRNYKERR
jgi:Pyruvate/2-oxoacid:ferredoxin oxidoreductase delta subunit